MCNGLGDVFSTWVFMKHAKILTFLVSGARHCGRLRASVRHRRGTALQCRHSPHYAECRHVFGIAWQSPQRSRSRPQCRRRSRGALVRDEKCGLERRLRAECAGATSPAATVDCTPRATRCCEWTDESAVSGAAVSRGPLLGHSAASLRAVRRLSSVVCVTSAEWTG